MSAHAYTEDQLVEQPAIGLFAELGWTTVSALEETFGRDRHVAARDEGEVVSPGVKLKSEGSGGAKSAVKIKGRSDSLKLNVFQIQIRRAL